jgi:manganese/zinc/iron transport system substrate-binding protein
MRVLVFLLLLLPGFALAEPAQVPTSAAKLLTVVATTSMIADAALNIGGERILVTALMGEGIDPHLYKPSPGDIRLISGADVVLYNGLHLEGRMADMLEKLAARKPVFAVTDKIPQQLLRSPPEFRGNHDPHIWFDVSLWQLVSERVREILAEQDPANADFYSQNFKLYHAKLKELDIWIREQVASVSPSARVLITAHDAFGYFGKAYNFEVLGIQGLSTDSEASIGDISHLVSLIVERKIRAVFVESSVPRKTIEALLEGARARGSDLAIGGELYSDAMGAPGTPEGTYIGMLRHNVLTMVQALTLPMIPPLPR